MNIKIFHSIRQISVFVSVVAVFSLYSCSYNTIETDDTGGGGGTASCEGCHTNKDILKQVYTPDSVIPSGGCGGEAPYYEPYDRVYMGGNGYEAFKASGHYSIGCTGCHGGVDNVGDKTQAHSGDWVSSPSMYYEEKCGNCHEQITTNYPSSIHNGTGQKRKVAIRAGLSGPDDFDQLHEGIQEGYSKNCAQCHGTCGNCHIVRPTAAGGGLANGHNFTKTPDMLNVCSKCHASRGWHAYAGVATGTVPDYHLSDLQYTCLDCHSGDEMHGNGEAVEQRYAYTEMPSCDDCHQDIESANSYHSIHYTDFNCQVCHSQDYNNCGNCHVPGDDDHKSGPGAQIPAYLAFKIAKNPIPDIITGFDTDLVTVRRTLASPENWDAYKENAYPNFAAEPTYNYSTPHNILRWTARTEVTDGKACSSNCHLSIDGETGDTINREFYLFQADLLDWEIEATSGMTVDDLLPKSWFESK